MALKNLTFDNTLTNTSILDYVGSDWVTNGSYQATNTGQSGTLSSAKDTAANVTFVFPQEANAVYYYGIRRCCGGLYAICLDCDPRSAVTNNSQTGFTTLDAVNRTDDGKNPPVVLWSTSFPTPGFHKVILTNQPDPRFDGNSQITLDQFVIQVEDDSSSSFSLSPSSPAPSSSTPSPAANQQSKSSPKNLGAILGALFGALILLGVVLFILFRRYRKRRAAEQQKYLESNRSLDPFMSFIHAGGDSHTPGSQEGATRTRTRRKGQEVLEVSSGSGSSASGVRNEKRGYNWTTGSGPGNGGVTTRAVETQNNPESDPVDDSRTEARERSLGRSQTQARRRRTEPRRETDAGRVEPVEDEDGEDEDEDDMRTLPPEYEQVFGGSGNGPRTPRTPNRNGERAERGGGRSRTGGVGGGSGGTGSLNANEGLSRDQNGGGDRDGDGVEVGQGDSLMDSEGGAEKVQKRKSLES